jgi:hypothetical protein
VAVAAKDTSLLRDDWIKQRKKASFYQRTFLFSVHLDTVEQQLSAPVVLSPRAGLFQIYSDEKTFHHNLESEPIWA